MALLEKYHAFCDESATSEKFTVIGVIMCHDSIAPKFEKWLEKITEKHGGSSELKWTKAKKHNLPLYTEYLSAFCKAMKKGYAKFHCIVIDNSKMNHKLYNDGDKEIGFNKMLFQILFSLCRKYRNMPRFYVYLDERTTKHTPEKLRTMLNAKARKDFSINHEPYRTCQFRKSHEIRLIQLTDLLCGCIHYKTNKCDQIEGAAKHKVALVNFLTQELGLLTLAAPSCSRVEGFDLWHIDLTKRAKGIPRS